MAEQKSFSPHLDHAKQILASSRGRTLTLDERKRQAVELASHIILEAYNHQTDEEKKAQAQLYQMMADPKGKPMITALFDQCFRPKKAERIIDQVLFLMDYFGEPNFFPFFKRLLFTIFRQFAPKFPSFFAPLFLNFVRKETKKVIIHAETMREHVLSRAREGIMLNINHLGEAILGEQEAQRRYQMYEDDLKSDFVQCVSVKISTIYSQISLLDRDRTVNDVAIRLKKLYRNAMENPFTAPDGSHSFKFVYLDMEEYQDLEITKRLFMEVLSEPEFKGLSAGIVLQAYLPDSYNIFLELSEWAKKRVKEGGAPIKVRIVKGANLAMEQFHASLHDWEQAPYTSKVETDANYKRILLAALTPENLQAVKIGIASHNIFDIAFAMILRAENEAENDTSFELLEGMANSTAVVVKELGKNILMYCGTSTKEDFASAIAYLIRRLDENTAPENYLRHSFNLKPGSEEWNTQVRYFYEACSEIETVSANPRRTQNRFESPAHLELNEPFENEPETDFSLMSNVTWGKMIIDTWKDKSFDQLPVCIAGKETTTKNSAKGVDPSCPDRDFYTYSLADAAQLEATVDCAEKAAKKWSQTSIDERCQIFKRFAELLRERHGEMLGHMMGDGGKTLFEADIEYVEGIDFVEYYIRALQRLDNHLDLDKNPKGIVLVTPPWNFPVSIPTGGVVAALITGNAVIFKPAPETVLCGYQVAKLLWEAGVPKDVLQFISCEDQDAGEKLIKDPRISSVILTGATATARLFYKMRPGLDLFAETGGKNAMIITSMADLDIAIKSLVQSAFGHAGQKCSAASLAIIENDVYDSPHFLDKLGDAAASLRVGSAWDLSTSVSPLIREPGEELIKGFTHLDDGEEWLLKPHPDPDNPCLWHPGIKIGVKRGSYSHRTEFFGPLLSVIKADNLQNAIDIANATPYGLTSGIQSLDEREQHFWQSHIVAGNCYINRTITGAIVQRQPFGGTKNSNFGHGAKAGGPNYLTQFLRFEQSGLPKEKAPVNDWVNRLSRYLERLDLTAEELGIWYASIANYAFWNQRMQRDLDLSKIVGQDNIFRFVKQRKVVLRIYKDTPPLDYLRIFAAALTCETPIHVSWEETAEFPPAANWQSLLPLFNIETEKEEDFLERVAHGDIKRVRMVGTPSPELLKAASTSACYIDNKPVMANGRLELINYMREVSLSIDYHRYGYLGLRENEVRKPIL